MFGYVKTDMPNMYVKDTVLYKAMYCGLCKGIGCSCGAKGRLLLNYDLTFLSLLLHNILNVDVEIEKQRCIIHQIKKRPVAVPDEITKRIASLNVILAHHKFNDDVIDSGKGRFARAFFNSAYKKAKRNEPILDQIVDKYYKKLLEYEKTNGDSIDLAADPFAMMMQEVVKVLVGEKVDDVILSLAYDLGKWVYLMDALDDFNKDKKKHNFNVFVNSYPNIENKESLVKEKSSEIIFIFGSILNSINLATKKLQFNFNHDLIDNILLRGLPLQTKQVMESRK